MTRYIVCTAVLALFVAGLSYVLRTWSQTVALPWFLLTCGVGFAVIVYLAFAYDRLEQRRAQRLQRSDLPDRQP